MGQAEARAGRLQAGHQLEGFQQAEGADLPPGHNFAKDLSISYSSFVTNLFFSYNFHFFSQILKSFKLAYVIVGLKKNRQSSWKINLFGLYFKL